MVSEMEPVNKNSAVNTNSGVYSVPQPIHSPHSVGMEFVRQYYTMLNRAPHLLFRFYSDDSTYVHGALDKPGESSVQFVRGQKQIYTKIMSLNFKNCHTKIRQVDSMETIGNGVVIQVIGELSNNNQPLRRFLQTFVLTPQSPNKYYVRNDMFRYQDDAYPQEAESKAQLEKSELKSENSLEVENVQTAVEPVEEYQAYPQQNGTNIPNVSTEAAAVEESVAGGDCVVMAEEKVDSVQETSVEANNSINVSQSSEVLKSDLEEADPLPDSTATVANLVSQQLMNEPKTYANMVSKSFQVSASVTQSKPPPPPTAQVVNHNTHGQQPVTIAEPAQHVDSNANVNASKSGAFPPQRERFSKKSAPFNRRNEFKENAKNDSDSLESDINFTNNSSVAAPKKYPDENQLFIGNLLPNFTEEDLRLVFQNFGKIIDIRIHRQGHKSNPNKAGRNYGFITFENPAIVDQIVEQKPFMHGNHRYNVEKKQGRSGNFERNRPMNGPNNVSPRNGNQSGPMPSSNSGRASGGPPGGQRRDRERTGGGGGGGANFNQINNSGNRNFGGPSYAPRNAQFVHQAR